MRNRRKRLSVDDYVDGVLANNRVVLSKAITLVESTLKDDNLLAEQVLEKLLPQTGKSIRIGITGVPGVGKSTFIEAFGKLVTSMNKHLAVLAIDPSSQRSRGSILGDKTRMAFLAADPMAYIRPSASGSSLGGVSTKTRETMLLCEAAGYDVIIVETVGVGQSETTVASMVDFFLLVLSPGGGDELQGIKKGVVELADAIAINKADGDNIERTEAARHEYEQALTLLNDVVFVECAQALGRRILKEAGGELAEAAGQREKPLLLKIAPDLNEAQLQDIVDIVRETGIDGVIATNTTIEREGLQSPRELTQQTGGLSGKPLRDRSTEVIRFLVRQSGGSFPVIGVGGIHSPEDALEKIDAGASLVQLWTGFVYEGPGLVKRINKAVLEVK